MKKLVIKKADLENGEIITLSDDDNVLELFFMDTKETWAQGFKISFNGSIIFSAKRFATAKSKFIELFKEKEIQGNYCIPVEIKITAVNDVRKIGSTVEVGKRFESELFLPQGTVYFTDRNKQEWVFWLNDTCKLIS